MKEQLFKLETEEGGYIALWKMYSAESNKNILLTHGTFSNRKVLHGIVEYFVENKFTCWVFEWRNHGESAPTKEAFDFETIGKKDFKILFNFLFIENQLKNIDCITHSGGGICLTIALINYPEYQEKIKSISMFACQSFGAAYSKKNWLKIYIGKYLSKMIGYVPSKFIGGVENEPYSLMKQWYNWNLKGEFIGNSGTDYKVGMQKVKTPVFSIFGSGDTFIAPPIGCRKYLSAFNNPLNKSLFCAKSEGFEEDYSHSRILHSRNARKEIYPYVLDWIKSKTTTNLDT